VKAKLLWLLQASFRAIGVPHWFEPIARCRPLADVAIWPAGMNGTEFLERGAITRRRQLDIQRELRRLVEDDASPDDSRLRDLIKLEQAEAERLASLIEEFLTNASG
jgi:hypothetical protein